MDAKSIIDNIIHGLSNGAYSDVNVHEQSVFSDTLLRDKAWRKIIIFVVVLLLCLIFLFTLASFLLQRIWFYPSTTVNTKGAIVIKQPCGIDHYIYLYNTARLWDNTGIDISKDDEVEIVYSGSYYSNAADLYQKSKDNERPSYTHFQSKKFIDGLSREEALVKHIALYRDSGAQFGHLLYQVQSIDKSPTFFKTKDNAQIYQSRVIVNNDTLCNKCKFTANKPGQLFVTVNDIFLFPEVQDFLLNNSVYRQALMESVTNEGIANFDSFTKTIPEIWFHDNIGEVLLSIRVRRNVIDDPFTLYRWYAYSYRWLIFDNGWLFFLAAGGIFLVICLFRRLYNSSHIHSHNIAKNRKMDKDTFQELLTKEVESYKALLETNGND